MKVFAVLLGPSGIGLLSLYHSVMSTVATVSAMGIASSGVRQIAAANGHEVRMANALSALRLMTIVLGTVGALILFFLRNPVSVWMFGTHEHITPLAVLSIGVLCTIIYQSQTAILNGLCRLTALARINVIGSACGTIAAIILIWLFGEPAVVYSIVASVFIMLICSSWFLRSVLRPSQGPCYSEVKKEMLSLLRLGSAFMGAGLMMTGALLFTRVIFLQQVGLDATGQFQAAWGIAAIFIDFILTAMSMDFYPHLTDCIKRDHLAGHRLVNQQTEVALLLGGPLIMGMLMLADVMMRALYSTEFAAATELLRLLLLGNILKIASWPLGYLIIAHAWVKTWVFTELVWASAYLSVVYLGCNYFGINSAGYAFLVSYLIIVIILYSITYKRAGFAWSRKNVRLIAAVGSAGILVAVLASSENFGGYFLGGVITCIFAAVSLVRLSRMMDNESPALIIQSIRKILVQTSTDYPGFNKADRGPRTDSPANKHQASSTRPS